MTEQIKAWAVVRPDGKMSTAYTRRELAESVAEDYVRYGLYDSYSVVELVQVPEKIKMTQAEWDEFEKLFAEYKADAAISWVLPEIDKKSNDLPNLCNWLLESEDDVIDAIQAQFATLWASGNPRDLVEIVEEEKKYELVTKLDDTMAWDGSFFTERAGYQDVFTQAEIDKLGGDAWLAAMGLTKVEVDD